MKQLQALRAWKTKRGGKMRECGVINCVHKYRFIFRLAMFISQLHLVQKSSDTIKLLVQVHSDFQFSPKLRFLALTEEAKNKSSWQDLAFFFSSNLKGINLAINCTCDTISRKSTRGSQEAGQGSKCLRYIICVSNQKTW